MVPAVAFSPRKNNLIYDVYSLQRVLSLRQAQLEFLY